MKASPIVAELDVPRNVCLRLLSRRIGRAVNALDFNCRVERLGERIVIADTCPADRLPYAKPVQDLSELSGRIIAAAVAVKDSTRRETEVTGGHLNRRSDQRCLVIIIHRPPDYLACRAVDHGGEVQPSFPRSDIGDVADHFLAWHGGAEVTGDQVRDRAGGALAGGSGAPWPRLAGHQAQLPHQGADQLRPGTHAPAPELGVHPAVTVGAVGVLERLEDQQPEFFPPFRRDALRPGPPFIESGPGYLKPRTHPRDRPSAGLIRGRDGGVLHIDELIKLAHRCSAAKYAAAFERNSLFILTSRFSRSQAPVPAPGRRTASPCRTAWSRPRVRPARRRRKNSPRPISRIPSGAPPPRRTCPCGQGSGPCARTSPQTGAEAPRPAQTATARVPGCPHRLPGTPGAWRAWRCPD